jgi:hypothetical protein
LTLFKDVAISEAPFQNKASNALLAKPIKPSNTMPIKSSLTRNERAAGKIAYQIKLM